MVFKKVDWRNLEFPKRRLLVEVNVIENDRRIERLLFNDTNGLKKTLNILRKHGIGELSNEDAKIESEQIKKELLEQRQKKGWLDKDIEW